MAKNDKDEQEEISARRAAKEHLRVFACCDTEMPSFDAIRDHLAEFHGIAELKGSKRGVLFLDMAGGHYNNTFEWTIGDVKFTETTFSRKVAR